MIPFVVALYTHLSHLGLFFPSIFLTMQLRRRDGVDLYVGERPGRLASWISAYAYRYSTNEFLICNWLLSLIRQPAVLELMKINATVHNNIVIHGTNTSCTLR